MMLLFLISAAITVFLLIAAVIVMASGEEAVEARLTEIAAPHAANAPVMLEEPGSGLAQAAALITGLLKPVRDFISGTDADLGFRLTLAGFRKPEHIEIYTALKMLLPVLAVGAGTFFGSNMLA